MALTLILALILAPVAAADNCVSSASWTKRDEPRKDCAWVGRLPEKRCDVRGAAPAGSDAAYAEQGNPPPCVWCAFDGAYVDENPNIWYLIHALTFNLPETLAPC